MGSNTDEMSDRVEILRRVGTGRRVVLKTEFKEKWEKDWLIIESTNLPLTDHPAPRSALAPAPEIPSVVQGQAKTPIPVVRETLVAKATAPKPK